MQALPDIPAERREDAAERYLANAATEFLPAERTAMARQVLAILDDKNFAEIFAPGSRAEVPIVGRIAARRRRSNSSTWAGGPIGSRWRYGPDRRLQDQPPRARTVSRSAERYVSQLALYRAVLAKRLSRQDGRRRNSLDGRAEAHGNSFREPRRGPCTRSRQLDRRFEK